MYKPVSTNTYQIDGSTNFINSPNKFHPWNDYSGNKHKSSAYFTKSNVISRMLCNVGTINILQLTLQVNSVVFKSFLK